MYCINIVDNVNLIKVFDMIGSQLDEQFHGNSCLTAIVTTNDNLPTLLDCYQRKTLAGPCDNLKYDFVRHFTGLQEVN